MKDKNILELSAENRVIELKATFAETKGLPLSNEAATEKIPYTRKEAESALLLDLKSELAKLDSLRKGDTVNAPIDITLAQYAKERWGIAPSDKGTADNLYYSLGLDPAKTTMDSLMSTAEINENYRWIIPEVILEAVRLGLRLNPIYQDLIRTEMNVSQQKVTMPSIKMSDTRIRKVGEFETIGTGTVAFGSKDVKISKMATGIRLSDEVVRYSSLNMLSVFLEDVGVMIGSGLDYMAIETLMLGDQTDGSDEIDTVGVTTAGTLAYKDLLRVWLRMQQLGNMPTSIILNENPAMDLFMLDEFRLPNPQYAVGSNPSNLNAPALNIRTALPQTQDVYVHGAIESNDKLLLLNNRQALMKLNASAMRVEQDRNAERQFDSYFISMITGFATLKKDARIMVDRSVAFSSAGFPAYMDVAKYQRDAKVK